MKHLQVGDRVRYQGTDDRLSGRVGEVVKVNSFGVPTAATVVFEGRFFPVMTTVRYLELVD